MIEGKGFAIGSACEVLKRVRAQTVEDLARRAVAADLQHVLVQIADGDSPFPSHAEDEGDGTTQALIDALRAAGLTVWGWAPVYGQGVDPDAQAMMFAERAQRFGLSGLVVDAQDHENSTWRSLAATKRAAKYIRRLRDEMAAVENLILGLRSYALIRFNQTFPFAAFLEGCDLAMPRIEWAAPNGGDPVRALLDSFEDYKTAFPRKPFVPTGAAYGGTVHLGPKSFFWSATPKQIEQFLDQAQAMRLPAVSFWRWEQAYNDPSNVLYGGAQLWNAVAAHPFTTETLVTEPLPRNGDARFGERTRGDLTRDVQSRSVQPRSPGEELLEINIDTAGYVDGVYAGQPHALLVPFTWQGQSCKYARAVADTPTSAWAFWQPDIQSSGLYEISVWVPGNHATTRHAEYTIHGVVGEARSVTRVVSQDRFFNEWVALGRFPLDANNPMSGHISLTNATGEVDERFVSFSAIRWRKAEAQPLIDAVHPTDGFDAPVGTLQERQTNQIWPGGWIDANPYGSFYDLRPGVKAYHTGADLNLHEDADRYAPVWAIAGGEVTCAERFDVWGNVVVIRHDPMHAGGAPIYARYAHLADMMVQKGERVHRGRQIGRVGQDAALGPFHLHFDISPTEVLLTKPWDWPGMDLARLKRDYVDPRAFIERHRPGGVNGFSAGAATGADVGVVQAEAQPASVSSFDFVQRQGNQFVHRGERFPRFIGVNVQGLVHYGDIGDMPLSQPGHRLQQLQAAHSMGARVVRVFLANHRRPPGVVVERMRKVLALIEHNHLDLYVIPALTNLYHNWGQFVQGDEHFFQNIHNMTLLSPDFFRDGFRRNYMPFVEQIVHELRNEPRIFAWEIGNELKAEGDPDAFVRFNHAVARRIKEIDPHHMVTTGMKSTQHAWMEHKHDLRRQLYATEDIDFVTVHSYENGPAEDDHGDSAVYADAHLAREVGKPLVVEEAGIFKHHNGQGIDRGAELEKHLARWLDQEGAYGYMQWGFDSLRIGDGDDHVGMVRDHHDWDDLYRRYQARAQRLA